MVLVASAATGLITSSIFAAASPRSGVRSPANSSPSFARPELSFPWVMSMAMSPSNTRRKATTAIVPITSRPVMISFFCNCIEAAFQNGTFSAAAQKLSDDRILGLFEFFGFGFFNDFSLVQHSHSCADAKGAVHFVRDGDGCDLRCFAQADN